MGTDTVQRVATIADLEQETARCELIDGEIVDMPPIGTAHARVMTELSRQLGNWNAKHHVG